MNNIVTTQIVKIGNSQGIRIPKPLLEQVGLNGTVQLEVEADHLILRPVRVPRQGWEEQYQRMAENGDDALLEGDIPSLTKWDETEWEW
jgi:antitoxin MazE